MFKNYLKIALRNIRKNRVYSFISIVGLALAVGCFTLPFLYVDTNNSYDTFHENVDKIYYVECRQGRKGGGELWGDTPIPLGPALKHDFPQVVDYVRIRQDEATVKIKDKIFKEGIYFVDAGFLEIFTFPMVSGDKNVLGQRNGIVITDRYVEKYFGGENPIGKEIIIANRKKFRESFVVKGVVKKPPKISSLQFDILLPFERFQDWTEVDFNDWGKWAYTFIQLRNKEDIALLKKQKLDDYIRLQNKAEESWPKVFV